MPLAPCHQQCVTEFGILAFGSAGLTVPECKAIRKEADSRFALSPLLLKHSDEQTLASLVAVFQAIESAQLKAKNFQDWAIISHSRFLGRAAFANMLAKYKAEGPWGASVQVIPHRTAHGISGTISLALKNHGPSIGVVSVDDGDRSALLALCSVIDESSCPAAWLVFSGWSPELQIAENGEPKTQSTCRAFAFAISSTARTCPFGRLRIASGPLENADRMVQQGDAVSETSSPVLFDFLSDPLAGNRWIAGWGDALQISIELSESVRLPRPARGPRVDTAHEGVTGHLPSPNHRPVAVRPVNIGQDTEFHG